MSQIKEPPRQVQTNSTTLTNDNSVWLFFALTLAWTYLFWGLRALIVKDVIHLGIPPDTLKFIGGFGPTIMALLLTYRRHGKTGVTTLLMAWSRSWLLQEVVGASIGFYSLSWHYDHPTDLASEPDRESSFGCDSPNCMVDLRCNLPQGARV